MNKQEIFYKVRKHLLQQGERCVDSEGKCLYRNEKGQKCAAGALIPDDVYEPQMEDRTFLSLYNDYQAIRDLSGREEAALISDLQDLHDTKEPKEWEVGLEAIRIAHGIDPL